MMAMSLRKTFSLFFLLGIALFTATLLQAWTGPTATAPAGNVAAPINVGATDQVKDAGISANSLAVFGSEYIQNKLGVGVASPVVAIETTGTIKIGDGAEVCQAVTEGAIRYNSTSKILEYCNATEWCPFTGCTGGSQDYTTPGTYTFTVPTFTTLSATVNGAGGGGGGRGNGPSQYGQAGSSGSQSKFGTAVIAGGGGGGAGGDYNGTAGATGSSGTASGGDTNTTGGGSAGGAYGSGSSPPWGDVGGSGGPGGQAVKTYSTGQLTVGASITVIVGAGGGGGQDGNGSLTAGEGDDGSVSITWD